MKLFFSIVISIVLITLTNCKAVQPNSSNIDFLIEKSETKKYAFGKGGGFTGDYDEYILYENGKVYKRDFNYDREIYLKQLSEVKLNYFLDKINTLGLEGIEINEPGNITTYIEVREANFSVNKIVWGANLYYPPNDLVAFHKEMFILLSAEE